MSFGKQSLAEHAEYCVEMANEAETKKEEAYWWAQYRETMIELTGNKNLFRKKRQMNNRPSKALIRTILPCKCGSKGFKWRKENGLVKLFCQCGISTGDHKTNSAARDQWNKIQTGDTTCQNAKQ